MTNNRIAASELPQIDHAHFNHHPKRFLNKKLTAQLVYFFPLLIGVCVLFFVHDSAHFSYHWLALGTWVCLLLFTLFVSYKEYFVRGYVLREHDISYRHGWIFNHQITVPFNRIQHTEVNQGPIDRIYNLCELEIFTAGGVASDLSISGLDPIDAALIKEFISNKVAKHA